MKRAAWLFVQDILEAIMHIESYVGTMTYEEFMKEEKTTSAVVWKIHVIGEATKNVPKTLRQKYPDIPWKDMAGMRDRIAHFYFGIDYEIVWKVITTNLQQIKPHVKQMLDDLKGPRLFNQ